MQYLNIKNTIVKISNISIFNKYNLYIYKCINAIYIYIYIYVLILCYLTILGISINIFYGFFIAFSIII